MDFLCGPRSWRDHHHFGPGPQFRCCRQTVGFRGGDDGNQPQRGLDFRCGFGERARRGSAEAQSCLASARTSEKASTSRREYSFDSTGHAVDARNVTWSNIRDHALYTDGAAGCWSGARIDGPYPENAVYECSSENGFSGGTCWDYHTTAGIQIHSGTPTVIEDLRILDYGDGVDLAEEAGNVVIRRGYFADLHDDAVEDDWGTHSVTVEDSLFERVFMGLAFKRRSGASDCSSGRVFALRNSLVQLHRFTNSYKQKAGHGGLYKDDEACLPESASRTTCS